ncbi:MAG: hypothetical protein HZR80_11730 [Candidatus Heimdallarchaeota archaeon]
MTKQVNATIQENVKEIDEMESNLQHVINDLIDEAEYQSKLVSQHVSMIITHLAMVAASLRVKKQQQIMKIK